VITSTAGARALAISTPIMVRPILYSGLRGWGWFSFVPEWTNSEVCWRCTNNFGFGFGSATKF
jgi:hypothetical protein